MTPVYDTYKNFPRKTNSVITLAFVEGYKEKIEWKFYNEMVVHNGTSVSASKEGILGDYYKLLFRYIVMNDRDQFDTFKWPAKFKKSLTREDWNWAESSIAIEKYQL